MARMIIGLVLFVYGGFVAVWPELMVRFQVWIQRVLMGAQYIPSQRTHTAMRLLGLFLLILGLFLIAGILK